MTLEETAKAAVHNAIGHAHETAEQGGRVVKHGYEVSKDELINLDPGGLIRRHLWLAIGAAFALGYVTARIVRRTC